MAKIKPTLFIDVYPNDVTGKPIRIPDVGSVIVRDYLGNEICVAQVLPTGQVGVSKATDADFEQRLNELGLKRVAKVIHSDRMDV